MTSGRTRDTVLVTLLALAVRLASIALLGSEPLFRHPVVDAAWHHEWAARISAGEPAAFAPFFRAPLYPWLLGLLYALTGPSVTAGGLLSVALSTTGCALFHRLALRCAGRGAALAASAAWALWGPDVMISGLLLMEPLYTTLLILTLLMSVRGSGGSAGLSLGAASIVRPAAVLLLPLVLWRAGRRWWAAAAAFSLPVAAVWLVNASAGDPGVVISSQGGINLYVGNGPGADGMTAFAPAPPGAPEGVDNVWAASISEAPPGLDPSGVSAWWTARTVEHVLSRPGDWALGMARKLLLLASPLEVPSNYDVYYMRRIDPVLRVLASGPFPALPFALLLLLLPSALSGGRPDRLQILLSLWALAILAGVAVFFVTYRFRLPAVPFLLLLTASRLDGRRLGVLRMAAGAVLAAGLGLATSGWERRAGVNLPFHDAVAHFEEGREEEAEALFLVSLERAAERPDLNMNRVEAMYDLGILAARRGDTARAAGWWRAALEAAPGWDAPRTALGTLARAPGMEP
jgi:hypothetical protein